ncbi:MAG: hypothetical protein ABI851_16550 [Saprospiraceae bacterium]
MDYIKYLIVNIPKGLLNLKIVLFNVLEKIKNSLLFSFFDEEEERKVEEVVKTREITLLSTDVQEDNKDFQFDTRPIPENFKRDRAYDSICYITSDERLDRQTTGNYTAK